MKGLFHIIIAAVAFSFYPLLNSISLQSTSPFLLALLIQIATILCSSGFLLFKTKSVKKSCDLYKGYMKLPFSLVMIPVLSGIAVYLGGLFFLFSLSLMSKAGAALIMETWPIIAIFLAPIVIFKKWQSFKMVDMALMGLSLMGLLMIAAAEKTVNILDFLSNPFFLFQNQEFQGYIGIIVAFLSSFCFAWASILRAHFANSLPHEFRMQHFGKRESVRESIFVHLLTLVVSLPFAFLSYAIMETGVSMEYNNLMVIFLTGASLTITSSFYSYALLKAENANINLVWYVSPVFAAIWLALFGYSEITEMLVAGGILIILANIILILTSKKKKVENDTLS